MPHVVLIRPLCEGEEPEFAEPLGIERLAGYLRTRQAARVTVIDRRLYQRERNVGLTASSFWADMHKRCDQDPPDVVGLSLMTAADVPDARRIIARIRGLWPTARLVAGGWYVTTNPHEAKRSLPQAVTLLEGEGEAALLSVVRAVASLPLSAGDDMPQIIASLHSDTLAAEAPHGTERREGGGPQGAADGQSPDGCHPEQHHTHALADSKAQTLTPNDWAQAYRPELVRYARLGCAVNIQTSRGCPGACTFCATPNLPSHLRRWQPRAISLVADEMEAEAARLSRAGLPPVFNCVDDDFGPLARVEALADELARRQLHCAFALEMRLAALTGQHQLEQRLARLHAAGLTRVFVGVESLNPSTLKRWHKPYDVTALPSVVAAFAQAGITLQAGYILWHQDQSVQGALREVEGLAALGIYSHRAALSRLIVFPGCALFGGADALVRRGSDVACSNADDARSEMRDVWGHAPVGGSRGQASHEEVGTTTHSVNERGHAWEARSKAGDQRTKRALRHPATREGYQSMSSDAEAFYQLLVERMGHLSALWTEAAIIEPYSAAQAYLTGDGTHYASVQRTLERVNEESLKLFLQLASDEVHQ